MDLSTLNIEFTMNAEVIAAAAAEAFAPYAKANGYEEAVCSASGSERVFINYATGHTITINADGSITLSPKTTPDAA